MNPNILGLSEKEANSLLQSQGLLARLVKLDGKLLEVKTDYRPNRINLELQGGKVVSFFVG